MQSTSVQLGCCKSETQNLDLPLFKAGFESDFTV